MLIRIEQTSNPFSYHLLKVPWSVFGVLTWEWDAATTNTPAAAAIRRMDVWRLLRLICRPFGLRYRNLATYRKIEYGRAYRGHCHFLVASLGLGDVKPDELSRALQNEWTRTGKGRAEVEPFDPKRQAAGVDYQTKLELNSWGEQLLPDEEFSPALWRMMQANSADEGI